MNTYKRLFGSGPLGVALSLAVTLAAMWASRRVPGALGLPLSVRQVILAIGLLGTLAGVIWTTRSLPVGERGRSLCEHGAYGWVRHPLYASFLTVGIPALALFLNHWIFLAYVAALHLLWHAAIVPEERMMRREFGATWDEYAARTGRFVPRPPWQRSGYRSSR